MLFSHFSSESTDCTTSAHSGCTLPKAQRCILFARYLELADQAATAASQEIPSVLSVVFATLCRFPDISAYFGRRKPDEEVVEDRGDI